MLFFTLAPCVWSKWNKGFRFHRGLIGYFTSWIEQVKVYFFFMVICNSRFFLLNMEKNAIKPSWHKIGEIDTMLHTHYTMGFMEICFSSRLYYSVSLSLSLFLSLCLCLCLSLSVSVSLSLSFSICLFLSWSLAFSMEFDWLYVENVLWGMRKIWLSPSSWNYHQIWNNQYKIITSRVSCIFTLLAIEYNLFS